MWCHHETLWFFDDTYSCEKCGMRLIGFQRLRDVRKMVFEWVRTDEQNPGHCGSRTHEGFCVKNPGHGAQHEYGAEFVYLKMEW